MSTLSPTLSPFVPSLDDLPAAPPGFGFDKVGEILAGMLLSRRSHAFVLGLHGPWGSGKTTLMESVRAGLGAGVLVIDFNAWKYAERTALWRALILRVVTEALKAGGDAKAAKELQESLYASFSVAERGDWKVDWTGLAVESVLMTMRIASAGLAMGPLAAAGKGLNGLFNRKKNDDGKLGDAQKSIERLSGILRRDVTQRTVQQVTSIEQFLDKFRQLVASLGADHRIVVLIDDLDRCLPETSLEIFEAIKLFLDAPECTYVVAVDRDVIARGLAVRYADKGATPVNPDEYIEKTITLSFDVPELTDDDCLELVSACTADAELNADQRAAIVQVLGANPRRLKRFARLLSLYAKLRPPGDALGDLDLKLALIAYCNSSVFGRLRREPELGGRLQQLVTKRQNALRVQGADVRKITLEFTDQLSTEHADIQAAGHDVRLWRAFSLLPSFGADPTALRQALWWFRIRSNAPPEKPD